MREAPQAQDLRDVGALWLSGYASQRPLVEIACSLLAQEHEGEGITALAGHSYADEVDTHAVEHDLRRALSDLGGALPDRESPELLLMCVRAMCRRLQRGEINERELAAWAHRVVGHMGADEAQPLVEADDTYDMIADGFVPESMAEVDERVRRTAALLAST